MAEIYYLISGTTAYLANVQDDIYTEHGTPSAMAVFAGKKVDISFYNNTFIFPSDCTKLFAETTNTTFPSPEKWDFSETTCMEGLFSYCTNLSSIDGSTGDTSNVTSMKYMFEHCTNLTSVKLDRWHVSNVNDFGGMFDGCSSLYTANFAFGTTSPAYAQGMFSGCSTLRKLELNGFTIKGGNLEAMFSGCSSLAEIRVNPNTNWYKSGMVDVNMFAGCTSLPNFNSSIVNAFKANDTDSGYFTRHVQVFWHYNDYPYRVNYSNYYIEGANLWEQYFPGVNGPVMLLLNDDGKFMIPENASYLFKGCTSIYNLDKCDLSYCKSMYGMMAVLQMDVVDLSSWEDLSSVEDMTYMFYGARVKSILVNEGTDGKTIAPNVTNSDNMFKDATGLPNFDPTKLDINMANNMGGYFGIKPEFRTTVTYEKQNGNGRQVTQVYEKYNNTWVKSDPEVKVG